MSLKSEIIAVGTELTNGAKLDTNSQWISRELEELGHPVAFHTSVADSLDDQVLVLRLALERSDLVIMTGGLGPTLDDLARDAVAAAIGDGLVLHEESLAAIEGFFRSRGRAMPERNRIQAMFPLRAEPLSNPIGTAPGFWYVHRRDNGTVCYLASLPGVPSEMKRMFHDQVLARLPKSEMLIRKHVWHCFGLGESDVEQLLGDLTARGRNPEVGITAHEATISLRIVARGITEDECQSRIAAASETIRAALGERVFGSDVIELEDVVLPMLSRRGWKLCSLECGPSVAIAPRLHRAASLIDSQSDVFRGGVSFPTIEAAESQWLMEPDASLSEGARLEALAGTNRKRAGADVCLAVSYPPIVEPPQRLLGWVAVAGPEFALHQSSPTLGTPDIQHSRLAKVAIDLLRRKLLSIGES